MINEDKTILEVKLAEFMNACTKGLAFSNPAPFYDKSLGVKKQSEGRRFDGSLKRRK